MKRCLAKHFVFLLFCWAIFLGNVAAQPPTDAPSYTVDQGSATDCSAWLYDSGGPDNPYASSENHQFTICPDPAPECLLFQFEYYNLELPDQLTFYDGPDTNAPLIRQLSNGGPTDGGGVCLRLQANSGCMTIAFQSDASEQREGWAGYWTCSSDCAPPAPLRINTLVTPESIAEALARPQTNIQVDSIRCVGGQIALFEADDTDLGLSKGVLLTNGTAFNMVGPNDLTDASLEINSPGDADLDYLSTFYGSPLASVDACVLELEVFANTDELQFEFIFGSEEYPEWINQGFNDIFAFLISGQDIDGDPNIGNQRNIAVLPGTAIPVQIDSVNNFQNWPYFRDNFGGQSLQYDGFTADSLGRKKSLTARAKVTPCNTYRLKLAIADRGDPQFDSGVFIAELGSRRPELQLVYNNELGRLVEGCSGNQDSIVINFPQALTEDFQFQLERKGIAVEGLDYVIDAPDSIRMVAGQSQLVIPIQPLEDTLIEGTEEIILCLSNDFGCGRYVYDSLRIELFDRPVLELENGTDSLLLCPDECLLLSAEGALTYNWQSEFPLVLIDSQSVEACPLQAAWVYVEGRTGACEERDSVYLHFYQSSYEILPEERIICEGESIELQAVVLGQGSGRWLAGDSSSLSLEVSPLESQSYFFELSSICDTQLIEVPVQVVATPSFVLQSNPPASTSTFYEGDPIQLAPVFSDSMDTNDLRYEWYVDGALVGTDRLLEYTLAEGGTSFLLEISNAEGCLGMASIDIGTEEAIIQFPNAFTPNGDKINDHFFPVIKGQIEIVDLQIYNRYGKKVFHNDNLSYGWNGTFKGQPMPSDVYIAMIRYRINEGAIRFYKGDFTLIR
ncbi:MAG: choice-of-anchor L domain-containing protein [Bacteroidota bacterium]